MSVESIEKDLLSHINTLDSLYHKIKLTQGSATIFNAAGAKLELCWNVSGDQCSIDLDLAAFGQEKKLGSATLSIGETTKVAGHIDNVAKAEVEVSLQSNPGLCFDATVCVKPFTGNWHCETTNKHCINL